MLKDNGEYIMTVPKYEQTLIDHSRHIIESDKSIKPLLGQINELVEEVCKEGEEGKYDDEVSS